MLLLLFFLTFYFLFSQVSYIYIYTVVIVEYIFYKVFSLFHLWFSLIFFFYISIVFMIIFDSKYMVFYLVDTIHYLILDCFLTF